MLNQKEIKDTKALDKIMQKAEFLDNDIDKAKAKLRSLQSKKCRLTKQKGSSDYNRKLSLLLNEEQQIKEVITYLSPKKIFATKLTESDIKELTYTDTMKAIKSIQSKKCNSSAVNDEEAYNKAVEIEKMLLEHKEIVKPEDKVSIKKSRVQNLYRHFENQETTISREYILDCLTKLLDDNSFMNELK